MSHYPIQQGLWESIDAILFNKAMALAKDVAAELNLPAQALIDILKKEERSKFTILPDDDMTYQYITYHIRLNLLLRALRTAQLQHHRHLPDVPDELAGHRRADVHRRRQREHRRRHQGDHVRAAGVRPVGRAAR